ncbi:unnamed protein product [Somion occarium]|uniref:Uncharacterized protein n=1 Tax=Somion occarium TaxID=3059160 RepID=A0ABP1E3S8_9APHY
MSSLSEKIMLLFQTPLVTPEAPPQPAAFQLKQLQTRTSTTEHPRPASSRGSTDSATLTNRSSLDPAVHTTPISSREESGDSLRPHYSAD